MVSPSEEVPEPFLFLGILLGRTASSLSLSLRAETRWSPRNWRICETSHSGESSSTFVERKQSLLNIASLGQAKRR